MSQPVQRISPLTNASGIAQYQLKVPNTCVWTSIFFYLGTPMEIFDYMHIPIKLIPQEIIDQYNLLALVSDGHVYVEVQKDMYGLPQSGILSNQLLARRLAIHGYHQTKITPGLWRHVTRPIQFTLVVDDFGVQYVDKEHAEHLIDALELHNYPQQQQQHSKLCHISLITAVLIYNPKSDVLHLTCNSRFTVTPRTYLNPNLSPELALISIWAATQTPA
jgi:hypothetical protein